MAAPNNIPLIRGKRTVRFLDKPPKPTDKTAPTRKKAEPRGVCKYLGEPILDANGQPRKEKCACKADAMFPVFTCLNAQNVRMKGDGSTVQKGAIPDVKRDVKNRVDVAPFFTACQFCEWWEAKALTGAPQTP